MFFKTNKKGFTLIELIVVMAVIGILVLLAIPRFIGHTQRAKITEIKSNIKQLENASERYYMDTQLWPKLTEEPYTAEQLEAFTNEIFNKTGEKITLEPNGKYYDIDYDKLQKYVQKPKNDTHYIIQNPVGEVFYIKNPIKHVPETPPVIQKPVAVITMTPEQSLTTTTNITWDYTSSYNSNGNNIVNVEWQGKQDIYATEGSYTVKLRVQDSDGIWSDWTEKTFFVVDMRNVLEIQSGASHTLILMKDGTVKAWGSNGFGQLGDGSTIHRNVPVVVSKLSNVAHISAGTYHSVALLKDGTIKTWGGNQYGQLGDGSTTTRMSPVTVPSITNAIGISAGYQHTLALLNDGTVKAWGYNNEGELGDGTTSNRTTPTTVLTLSNVKQIEAGEMHNIALISDGTVKTWGYNGNGRLGDGGYGGQRNTPFTVPGISTAIQVASGSAHTVALLNDGTVKIWGNGYDGQMGTGTIVVNNVSPITIPGLSGVKQIDVGASFTIALMGDGTVKTWGFNAQGQLGLGTWNSVYSSPTTIPGLSNVSQISAGHQFASALLSDGNVKTWGINDYGQLGDGTNTLRRSPVSVVGLN